MFVSYRAKDREEFWKIRGSDPKTSRCDPDGLAPGEDKKFALRITGELIRECGDGRIDIRLPVLGPRDGVEQTVLHGVPQSESDPPQPGTWKAWSG